MATTAFYDSLPIEIQTYAREAAVTVIKNKVRASVYLIEKYDYHCYLKITPKGHLQNEVLMTEYLHRYGICPTVILYISDDSKDYLLTERVTGSDATRDEYLAQPDRLVRIFAESLAHFHHVRYSDCPISNDLEQMVMRAEGNYRKGRVESSLLQYVGYTNIEAAYSDLVSLFNNASEDNTIIHGDYCLPNVILHDFRLSGFIDVGYGGIGDRHYDIFWGLWSLEFNLKCGSYAETFLQSYGKQWIDHERLRLCGLLSAFNGYRGMDYYSLPQ